MEHERIEHIYTAYVETITAAEARRQSVLSVYVSLLIAGLALASTVDDIDLIWLASSYLILGIVWWQSVSYYQKLAQVKFSVIKNLERKLPIAPFALEWEEFKYVETPKLSSLEMRIPQIVVMASALYICYRSAIALKLLGLVKQFINA